MWNYRLIKTWLSHQLKVPERILYYIGLTVFKNSSSTTELQYVYGKRKVLNRWQPTVNISSDYLWIMEKDQLINSLFPKFPRILCFSERHLKRIELEQISLKGFQFGAAYCRKSSLKGGFYIFVHKK
jgi:hypothetical protein